jgi:hypothetical protein
LNNRQIVRGFGYKVNRGGIQRNRWRQQYEVWEQQAAALRPKMSDQLICEWLADAKHTSMPSAITKEQRALSIAWHVSRRKSATRKLFLGR